jgi:integrase
MFELSHNQSRRPVTRSRNRDVKNGFNKLNLSSVIERIRSDQQIDKEERIYRCSGLRTFSRCIGIDPDLIPISAIYFRNHARFLTPARTNLSANRLGSVKSQLGFVLEYVLNGEGIKPRDRRIGPHFDQLLILANNMWLKMSLRRFFHFCTREKLTPTDVDDGVVRLYQDYLTHCTLVPNPSRTVLVLKQAWNSCCRSYASWPQRMLTIADRSPTPRSPEFEADVGRYGEFLAGVVPHPDTGELIIRPLAQASVTQHVRALRRSAATFQARGLALTSIADLIEASSAFAFHNNMGAADQRLSPAYCHRQNLELRLAARRWILSSGVANQGHKSLAANAVSRSSPKKFEQIFGLLEAGVLAALLSLPEKLMMLATQYPLNHPKRRAVAQVALATEIILMLPLLPAQVAGLQPGASLLEDPAHPESLIVLAYPPKDLHRELRYRLPSRSARLFQQYKLIRPLRETDRFLFPSRNGGRRQTSSFSQVITSHILRHVGVQITPQALRFLGATLYLIRHPQAHETVRQAIGHKSLAHTRRVFRFVRVVQSSRGFDTLVMQSGNERK